jgi:uncharacterized protein YndB with AHSA1/START domain
MSEHFNEGWSEFTRRVFISADAKTVFQHWTQSGLLEKWMFKKADYLDGDGNVRDASTDTMAGDQCHWIWNGWDHVHEGSILAIEPAGSSGSPFIIEFSFGPAGKVRVDCLEVGPSRTELVLTQSEIPHATESEIKDYYYGCSMGWSFWMLNLKAFLEHGIVLNELDHPYTEDTKRLCELVNH